MPIPLYQAKAEFFRTLGHPARIRILELLSDEDRPVHQLLAAIAIEPSNLSQQLSVLRQAGLVSQRREGGEVIYSLALPEVRDLLPRRPHTPGDQALLLGRPRRRDHPRDGRGPVSTGFGWVVGRATALVPRRSDLAAMLHSPRRDVVAGLTVGVVALPLALGFGISSGLGAGAGLVTAIVAGIVAAVMGGSNLQVSGPTGAMTVVLIPIVAAFGASGVLVVGLLAGLLLLAMAVAGLGTYVRFIPLPVVEGFTLGIALIIALQQVPSGLGTTGTGEHVYTAAGSAVLSWFHDPRWWEPVVTAGVIAVMLVTARVRPALPGSLIAVVLATGACGGAGTRHRPDRGAAVAPSLAAAPGGAVGAPPGPAGARRRGRRTRRAREPAVGQRRRRDERLRAARPRPGAVRPGPRQPGQPAVRRAARHRRDRAYGGQRAQRSDVPDGGRRPRAVPAAGRAPAGPRRGPHPAGRAGRRPDRHRRADGRGRVGPHARPGGARGRGRARRYGDRHGRLRPRHGGGPRCRGGRRRGPAPDGAVRRPRAGAGHRRGARPPATRSTRCSTSTSWPTGSTVRCSSRPPTGRSSSCAP